MSIYEKAHFHNAVLAGNNSIVKLLLVGVGGVHKGILTATIPVEGVTGIALLTGLAYKDTIIGVELLSASSDVWVHFGGLQNNGADSDIGWQPTALTAITIASGSYFDVPVGIGRVS